MTSSQKKKFSKTKLEKSPGKPIIGKQVRQSPPTAELISIDWKGKIFLFVLLAFYFIVSLAKIHTSSIAVWDYLFGNRQPESVISGEPKGMRQDEWMVITPALIGNTESGMHLSNAGLGAGNTPVISGFPIRDYTMVLRPSLWPYFIMDTEHAFAFSWNFNIFLLVITSFLLFMLLTRNNFWVSVFGALFIFLAGAVQWWSYLLGTLIIYLNAITISVAYLIYSKLLSRLFIAGSILLVSSYSFVVTFYPPWQIPIAYLYLFVFIGYVFQKKGVKKEKLLLRGAVLISVVLILAIFLFHYYSLSKDTFKILANTAYPGRRTTNGGDLIAGKLFSDFFAVFLSEGHVPDKWLNICEASSFMIFFPIIFYCMAFNFIKYRKFDWLQIFVGLYIVTVLIWLLVGFPSFVSNISLMSYSPAKRALPIFGLANLILLTVFIGNKQEKLIFSRTEFIALIIATIIFSLSVVFYTNNVTAKFFTTSQLVFVSVLIPVIYLLIRYKDYKFSTPILILVLLGLYVRNLNVNPITEGLASLKENRLVAATKEIHDKDPQARWAVFGYQGIANLLKVNGINVFNGVKWVPALNDMKVLDSANKFSNVYNRYAHIVMELFINWEDSVRISLIDNKEQSDIYKIAMDPCSPRLQKLGVKYILFTYKPQEVEIRCMKKVVELSSFSVYKREDDYVDKQ